MEQSIPFRKKYRNSLCPYFNAWLDGVIVDKSEDGDDDAMDDDDLDDDPDASLTDNGEKKKKNASISQLISMSTFDWPLLATAFLALIVAAVGQAFIPKLTGNIINSVAHNQDLKMLENAR